MNHLRFIRNLIASMVSDARYRKGGVGDGDFFLPGFNMPKGEYCSVKQQPLQASPCYENDDIYQKHT